MVLRSLRGYWFPWMLSVGQLMSGLLKSPPMISTLCLVFSFQLIKLLLGRCQVRVVKPFLGSIVGCDGEFLLFH